MKQIICAAAALLALGLAGAAQAQQGGMSFFVTSVGIGKGGDLGGLAGADRHCQQLAQAVGAGGRTWRAYLSTQAARAARPQSTPATASAVAPGRTPRASKSPRTVPTCIPTTTTSRR